jgi:hypothetical protein
MSDSPSSRERASEDLPEPTFRNNKERTADLALPCKPRVRSASQRQAGIVCLEQWIDLCA